MSLALPAVAAADAFREAGYDVVGVSAPGDHVATLAEHGIGHVALQRSTRAADLRSDLATAREFVQVCRRLEPDIVHTHNPKPGVYGRIGARLAGVPVVVNTVHGLYAQPDDRLREAAVVYGLERIAATCSDAELLQNPEDLPVLRRLGIPAASCTCSATASTWTRFDPTGTPTRAAAGARRARHRPTTRWSSASSVGWSPRRATARCSRPPAGCATTHPTRPVRGRRAADLDKADAITRPSSTAPRRGGRRVPRDARRRRAALPGDGPLRPRLAPRGLPPLGDGGRGDGAADRRDRHPRLPAGRRRRNAPAYWSRSATRPPSPTPIGWSLVHRRPARPADPRWATPPWRVEARCRRVRRPPPGARSAIGAATSSRPLAT
jgi:hypothetical protein